MNLLVEMMSRTSSEQSGQLATGKCREGAGKWRQRLLALLLCFALLLGLTGCEGQTNRYQAQFFDVFDTVSQIVGYERNEQAFTANAEEMHRLLLEYHHLYDIYNDYEGMANLKTVNDMAGKEPVQVDQRIIELLIFAKEAYTLTEGRVNVAYGAVLSLWHEKREANVPEEWASLPEADALAEAAQHTSIEDVIIDEEASTVYLRDPMMSLDVGGIAKGYATEQVALQMEAAGVDHVLMSIGGNIRAIGKRGDGADWVCAVESPYEDGENDYLARTYLDGMSLITSGDYQRYYVVDGKRYHHIIDPQTTYPADYHRSVSILAADSGLADAISTAVFLMPFEEGLDMIESMDGIEALWAEPDGDILMSSGFEAYLVEE